MIDEGTNLMVDHLFDLTGKRAVITGGSRGIGLMMAEGLLAAGAAVTISSRSRDDCDQAVAALSHLGEIAAEPADLSQEAECRRLADAIAARADGVDVLINNAGVAVAAPFETFPADGWDNVLDVNLKAPFHLTRAMLPSLTARATACEPSRVINLGSIAGLRVPAQFDNFSYSAAKAGVHHLTRVLAHELAPRHILVNAVAPGPFETKMMRGVLARERPAIEANCPLGRIGETSDMAGIAIFLASRASAYITGAVIPVDGGISTTATLGLLSDQ